jgi:putative transposase
MKLFALARNELARLILRFDVPSGRGRPRKVSNIEVLDRVFYLCRTGCQWSELPCPRDVHYKTVFHRFRLWSKHRVFEDAFYNLSTVYRQTVQLPLIADTSYVKNVRGRDVLGKNHTDRGRRATKVSLLSDAHSVPIAFAFHTGNKNDCMTLSHLLDVAKRKTGGPLTPHQELYADKGYDSQRCRNACIRHNLQPLIPHRGTNETWSPVRCAVEVTFGRLDNFRRVIVRYDSLIKNFKSLHYLAALHLVVNALTKQSRILA